MTTYPIHRFSWQSALRRLLSTAVASVVFGLGSGGLRAITPALSGTLNSADPSPLVYDGSTFYQFTTGTQGVWYSHSSNLSAWTAGGYISPSGTNGVYPSWIQTAVPGWTVGNFWAPDVVKIGSNYWMYYAVSTFGSSTSAIGLAKATSLTSMNWQDQGMVVSSNGSSTAFNAIDPCLFQDTDGTMWLSYGSFFGGIAVVQIDPATMKVKSGSSAVKIAGGSGADWEGSYITKNNGYYYLWANRGACCNGVNSTYTIVVGRSTSITGPYLNQTGGNLTTGGANGTLVLGTIGNKISPGGVGLLVQGGCNYMSYFYYDGNSGGTTLLDIDELTYTGDWPGLTNSFTIGQCGTLAASPSSLSFSTSAAGSSNVTITANQSWTASTNQTWLTTSPSSGSSNGVVAVSVTANTGSGSRSGVVTFHGANGLAPTVSVTQLGTASSLSATPTSLSFTSSASSSTETVSANVAWSVSSSQSWLTVSPSSGSNSGSFTATVTANTGSARTATITLTGSGVTQSIAVSQAAPTGTGPIAAGTYRIKNYDSGYSLAAANTNVGTAVTQVTYTAASTQKWDVSIVSTGIYKLTIHGATTVIAESGGGSGVGTLEQLASYTGATSQQFILTATGDGTGSYYIQANNGGNYVGEPQYSGANQQAQLQQKQSYNWQRWQFLTP